MLYEISERFGRRLPFSVLFPDVTVEKLAAALQQAAPCDPAGAPVQVSHVEGSRPPLIFFHGDYRTGGLYAARLTRLLGPDQPLFIVHPHGMNGETVPSTIEEMADDRLAAILALLPPGPVIVGGYCNGGLVAYETGLRLSRMGRDVLATIAIDAAVRTTRFRALSRGVQRYAAYRGLKPREARDRFLAWRDRQATVEQLLDLSDHSRFGGFADRVAFVARSVGRNIPGARRRSGGEEESPAVSRTAEEARWAHYVAAIDAYVPATTSGKVVVLLSDDLLSMGADRAWRRLARNVEVRRIEGGHYECVTAYLATLAAAVAEAAAKAAAAAGIEPAAVRL
jgi:thioesterase domain-containing protein